MTQDFSLITEANVVTRFLQDCFPKVPEIKKQTFKKRKEFLSREFGIEYHEAGFTSKRIIVFPTMEDKTKFMMKYL